MGKIFVHLKTDFISGFSNLSRYENATDGGWSPWGNWGSCSATCGGGIKKRQRRCDDPSPSILGRQCVGNDEQAESCMDSSCSGKLNWKLTLDRYRLKSC